MLKLLRSVGTNFFLIVLTASAALVKVAASEVDK